MRIQQLGSTTIKLTSALALCVGLAACGGGDSGNALDRYKGNSGGGDGGSNSVAQLGSGTGADFTAGEISTGIGDATLSAGGSTVLTVNVVEAGELVTDSVQITFNSACIASGEASIKPVGLTDESETNTDSNVVATNNGQARVNYTANGCIGEDIIKARATYGGGVISATASLNVESDTVTSIFFTDASPNYITLKGSGGNESSVVRFQILGATGAAMKGVEVSFALNSTAGGLKLTRDSDVSGTDGYVSTTVQSGTSPSSVRVTATTDTGVSTQSNQLVVSTGLPVQKGINIAASDLYPIAWDYNNVESDITVNLADAFNNPVPNGTPVYFSANNGIIEPACHTGVLLGDDGKESLGTSGTCTVTWRSSGKLYAESTVKFDEDRGVFVCPNGDIAGNGSDCRHGRLKVIATTIGNESFIDVNRNGLYDHGIDIFYSAKDASGARAANCKRVAPISGAASRDVGCDDLGSAYIDRNFDGVHSETEEVISIDNDGNGQYVPGNGIYNGSLCRKEDAKAGHCSRDSVLIRDDITLIAVSNAQHPFTMPDGRIPGQPKAAVRMQPGGSKSISMMVADHNGNGLPRGTKFSVNSANGIEASITPDGEIGASNEGTMVTLTFKVSDSESVDGVVSINVAMPGPDGEGETVWTVGQVLVQSYAPSR